MYGTPRKIIEVVPVVGCAALFYLREGRKAQVRQLRLVLFRYFAWHGDSPPQVSTRSQPPTASPLLGRASSWQDEPIGAPCSKVWRCRAASWWC